jgi:hypothetical protein
MGDTGEMGEVEKPGDIGDVGDAGSAGCRLHMGENGDWGDWAPPLSSSEAAVGEDSVALLGDDVDIAVEHGELSSDAASVLLLAFFDIVILFPDFADLA